MLYIYIFEKGYKKHVLYLDIVDTMSADRKVGNVKWFNNKAGYGFITMGENTGSPQDIFVHYTNISVGLEQYKYLVQGEYVEFDLSATPEGTHEFQATNVTGIQGGATLCERRRQSREAALDSEEDRAPRPSAARVVRRQPSVPAGARTARKPRVDVAGSATNDASDADGFRTVKRQKSVSRATL
jgi:cold shock CspA family protein